MRTPKFAACRVLAARAVSGQRRGELMTQESVFAVQMLFTERIKQICHLVINRPHGSRHFLRTSIMPDAWPTSGVAGKILSTMALL